MPSAHLTLREEDVVRLTLEFLHNRDLHISQLSVERETGVINGNYSDDVLFLRQLILDGQWDDVIEFIQPLEAIQTFDMRKFSYAILRHKYIELLCIKSEAGQGNSVDNAVEEVVKVLSDLEKFAPSKEEYSNLCLLLTLPRLADHLQYRDWNPSNARVQCFREVFPLVERFLPGDRKTIPGTVEGGAVSSAKNDRLIQLIIKGILYESCVNYCQAKATGTSTKEMQSQEMNFSRLLDGSVGFSDSDLSLLSWLQSIPSETFSVPFEQRTLNVDVERLERPSLETSWTEHMLVTPIKPKTFPHSAMPFTRPRSAADIMTRSLLPALDGLPFGLAHGAGHPGVMSSVEGSTNNPMSRSSFASFHLTGIKNNKLMNSSVDRLFESDGDVFLSSSYADFQQLPSIQEVITPKNGGKPRSRSKSPDRVLSQASTPEHRGRESPATSTATSTARSSRRDSLTDKPPIHLINPPIQPGSAAIVVTPPNSAPPISHNEGNGSFNGELLKEYQRQKQKLQETLQAKEKEREDLYKQIHGQDNRIQNESFKQPVNKPTPLPQQNGTTERHRHTPPSSAHNGGSDIPIKSMPIPENATLPIMERLPEGHYDAVKNDAAVKRLEALFKDVKIDNKERTPEIHVHVEHSRNIKCDVHGSKKDIDKRRGSLGNILHLSTRRDSLGNVISQRKEFGYGVGPRRESMPALNMVQNNRRRDSFAMPRTAPLRQMEHPSAFPSMLRQSNFSNSTNSLRRDVTGSHSNLRRDSLSSYRKDSIGYSNNNNYRKDSLNNLSNRRDFVGSNNSLRKDSTGNSNFKKDSFGNLRRDSIGSVGSVGRRLSTDSLDIRRNSWDPGRRGSGSSSGFEDPIWEETSMKKPVPQPASGEPGSRPRFVAVTALEDVQAVRCAEFHPNGKLYAVGSNSKTLRICAYPPLTDVREDHTTYQPTVLFKRTKHHKGSIYCLAWSPVGDLMATGSNDKTVKLMRFNAETSNLEGQEVELNMHDGTVRDLCFLEDSSNKSSLLISGGAGDCKIYVTDCATGTPFQALSGHSGHVLSLYNWGGAMFVSGSQDKTVRFWDLRTRGCVNMVTPATVPGSRQGSPVAGLCVDPSGRLLVSGHEDSSCVLFDIRGGRPVQCFKPHASDIRSIRFSPSAYYLLTGGYDNKLVLTDLQGDLTMPLPSVVVAQHSDKVISGRWHPSEFSFLSTSADKTATLWALPPV